MYIYIYLYIYIDRLIHREGAGNMHNMYIHIFISVCGSTANPILYVCMLCVSMYVSVNNLNQNH